MKNGFFHSLPNHATKNGISWLGVVVSGGSHGKSRLGKLWGLPAWWQCFDSSNAKTSSRAACAVLGAELFGKPWTGITNTSGSLPSFLVGTRGIEQSDAVRNHRIANCVPPVKSCLFVCFYARNLSPADRLTTSGSKCPVPLRGTRPLGAFVQKVLETYFLHDPEDRAIICRRFSRRDRLLIADHYFGQSAFFVTPNLRCP